MNLKSFMYFYPEKPTLSHIDQIGLYSSREWVAEKKYNEQRLQLHCLNGGFQFWNRHEKELSYNPTQEIIDSLRSIPLTGYTLFDGGLRHNKTIGVRNKVIIFDIFILNGKLLVGKPFHERRKILEDMFTVNAEPVGLIEQYRIGFKKLFETVIEDPEIEGLVIKNLNGKLALGRRNGADSNWMVKVRKPSGRYNF